MERIDWIDMGLIRNAKALVAGAGALGNEVIKNLVLAGFRRLDVVDDDRVEETNLCRCVLFRPEDIGSRKAEVACRSARRLDSGCEAIPFVAQIQSVDLSGYDVIIGCVDNIGTRLHLNSHAKYLGIPYVDGATDGFRGKIQVVLPEGPCMECGMNSSHLAELHTSFSCDPDKREIRPPGPIVPSGITTTSVIAGMCAREAIKIVCKTEKACVRGISYYDGLRGTLEKLEFGISPRCPNHEGEKCQSN